VCGDEKKCMMVNCQKLRKSSDCFHFECAEPNWGYCCIRRVCEHALPVSVLSLSLHVFVSLSQCNTAHYTKYTFLNTQTSQPGDPSLDPVSKAFDLSKFLRMYVSYLRVPCRTFQLQ
jgi:hypothetical protein